MVFEVVDRPLWAPPCSPFGRGPGSYVSRREPPCSDASKYTCTCQLPVWRCWAACSGSHNAAIHLDRGSRRCRMTPAVGALADVRSLRQCDGGLGFRVQGSACLSARSWRSGWRSWPTMASSCSPQRRASCWFGSWNAWRRRRRRQQPCCRRPSSRQRGGLAISGCSATADSWGRLKGRWPPEWSQELHCCQIALRAGGFALDYCGSAVAAAGGACLHVQCCRSQLLLVSRQRGGGQQLRFKLDGRPQPQPLACDEHVPSVVVRRCGGVQRACADLDSGAAAARAAGGVVLGRGACRACGGSLLQGEAGAP